MHNKSVEISASIMCINWLEAGNDLNALERNKIDYLHWDIIDGSFAPDFTMGSSIINSFREITNIRSDYHLMVEEPSKIFDMLSIETGDIVTIHQECSRNLHRDLISLRRRGCRVGIAICPGTSLETLEYVIEDADVILVMTVNPGFKGQKLVSQTLRKIERLKKLIQDLKLDIKIEVDGNVCPQFIPEMVSAGADILVGGSSGLFRKDIGIDAAVISMYNDISQGLESRKIKGF
jgi:ribulose-phosphate 3-epimerase